MDYIAVVILCLSTSTSFFTIVVRLFQWHNTFNAANVPNRLVLGLAFSDWIGSTIWLIESVYTASASAAGPAVMAIVYFGFVSSCLITNCIGIHLVLAIHLQKIPEKFYYIFAFGTALTLLIVWINLDSYVYYPNGICWFNYIYNTIFWTGVQIITFVVNAIVFGYITQKILASRKAWWQNNAMRDKEKRSYLLLICFFVPTCGGIMNIIQPLKLAGNIGLYLINLQGFLNSIAMNEKMVHDAVVRFYQQKMYFSENFSQQVDSPVSTIQPPPSESIKRTTSITIFTPTEETVDTLESDDTPSYSC
eukprot:Phypoly_transcript_13244.p1 GENE.Phypoly_transcript_13244~~Phypoly_transcript_13244.p1  ORF type:complete len:306 (+),score=16.23 Phypoly_transcript_13244:88-1005(+)